MKLVLVITILSLLRFSSATFGPNFFSLTSHLNPPTTTTTMAPTTTDLVPEESAPTTSVLDLILDVANESMSLDTVTSPSSVFSEEVTFNPLLAPPPPRTVCVKSNTLTLLRWIERRLQRLVHALLELLVIPLEFIRGAIGLILGSIADSIFSLFGYNKMDCRYRFTCNAAVVTSNYLPQTLTSFIQRNYDVFVRLASKLKILDFENEYIQAAIVGSFEGNCKIYDQVGSCK